MTRTTPGVLIALLLAASVLPAHALSIHGPDWAQKPSKADVLAAYPARARELEIEGRAAFSCTVDPSGRLHDCRVEDEGPEGFGFGQAALSLAPLFVMKIPDGAPAWRPDARTRIPIRFALP